MNKIASILFLEDLGICRTPITIVTGKDPMKVVKNTYRGGQWVIRCGDHSNMEGVPEPYLPWAVADNLRDLVSKINEIQKKVPNRLVFIHRQREIAKSGEMLIDCPDIIIEGNIGDYRVMADHAKGKINPQAIYYFKAGSKALIKKTGKEVFNVGEICELLNIERILPYEQLGLLTRPLSLEFSVNHTGNIDCHDIKYHEHLFSFSEEKYV